MTKKKLLEHEDLDFKNNLLGAARNMWASDKFEAQLASLIIYASFAEYLAEHLLGSIKFAVETASYERFGATIFLNSEDKKEIKPLFMYDYINRLKTYEFPDKTNIVPLFEEVSRARNRLFHDFTRIKPEDANKLDQYAKSIQEGVEELINRVNTVENTIKILTNYGASNQKDQQVANVVEDKK